MHEAFKRLNSIERTLLFCTCFMSLLGVYLTGYSMGCGNFSSAATYFANFVLSTISFLIVLNKVISKAMDGTNNGSLE